MRRSQFARVAHVWTGWLLGTPVGDRRRGYGGRAVGKSLSMMTAGEVARYLRVHTMTIYRMIQRGGLPAVRVGRVWRFRRDHIDRWLLDNGINANDEPRRAVSERRSRTRSPR
ncbi:MAG: helix-turn-helix domain-containing protein [Armatimonadetes bacterium]|nr:helix-turn-helix domain-containing protein [Armatimonadota bacterium]